MNSKAFSWIKTATKRIFQGRGKIGNQALITISYLGSNIACEHIAVQKLEHIENHLNGFHHLLSGSTLRSLDDDGFLQQRRDGEIYHRWLLHQPPWYSKAELW